MARAAGPGIEPKRGLARPGSVLARACDSPVRQWGKFRAGTTYPMEILWKADLPVTNLAGQAVKLSDLQAESLVTLKLNSEDFVVAIVAPLPTVHGPLTDVDAKKSEIVLKVLTGLRTIALAPDTKIYLD